MRMNIDVGCGCWLKYDQWRKNVKIEHPCNDTREVIDRQKAEEIIEWLRDKFPAPESGNETDFVTKTEAGAVT